MHRTAKSYEVGSVSPKDLDLGLDLEASSERELGRLEIKGEQATKGVWWMPRLQRR